MSVLGIERLSFRDPGGFVARFGDRILRAVEPTVASDLDLLLAEGWYRELVATGDIVGTERLGALPSSLDPDRRWTWYEHPRLTFPVYPHELTATQLFASAMLTLKVARTAVRFGWMLKDGSAWNVLFDRGRPRLVDVLSFERLSSSGMWPAYGQFCRHYSIPLLLFRRLGVEPAEAFWTHRDGVSPERARAMLPGFRAWLPPALELVTLPVLLGGLGRRLQAQSHSINSAKRSSDVAASMVERVLSSLERQLLQVQPNEGSKSSTWSGYEGSRDHYRPEDLRAKTAFVQDCLASSSGRSVLDLGCNTGEYSRLAATLGKSVVAADSDGPTLARLFEQVQAQGLDVNPVLLDLGRPTPALGWMNQEVRSFVDRSRGQFDSVLALGLVHHLLVKERAPLIAIVQLLAALDPSHLIVEWVSPDDPRFREIAGINGPLYNHLESDSFEDALRGSFRVVRRQAICDGKRVLYLCDRI